MGLPFYIAIEKKDLERIYPIIDDTFSFLENISGVSIPRRYVGDKWKSGEFGGVDWYVKRAWNFKREQANTSILWEELENEPWQRNERHYELIILESDLYAPETNFVFGETKVKIANSGTIINDYRADGSYRISGIVLSINRVKRWYESWEKSFSGILLHEEGHFYGLPSSSNPNYLQRGDPRIKSELDDDHCNDRRCIMEQVNTPGRISLIDKVNFVERENPNWFCKYDSKALKENLRRLY